MSTTTWTRAASGRARPVPRSRRSRPTRNTASAASPPRTWKARSGSSPARSPRSRPRSGVPRSDRLELLERLLAAAAVTQRAARRRAEDVLERRVARAAVGAAEAVRLQLYQRRPLAARGWRREAGLAELLAALGCDLVGRPGVVEHDLDLRLGAELGDPLGHLRAHHLQGRAAEEGRRELDVHPLAGDA